MKVLLLARALGIGGTERQVTSIAQGLARRGHNVSVLTFYASAGFDHLFSCDNVELLVLGKRSRGDIVRFVWRLLRSIAVRQPDVIYSFLPVPNLLASLARLLVCRRAGVVWGIRGTRLDLSGYEWLERLSIRMERWATRSPDLVIANSHRGAEWVRSREFGAKNVAIVANGIDTATFFLPSRQERAAARVAFGYAETDLVVAFVARFHPMKDHPTFLRALATAAKAAPHLRALIVGERPNAVSSQLREMVGSLGIADRVTWLSERQSMTEIYHAADLLCLSSTFGEGFPNVVGEAMASGVPCIVTPIGDSADVVGQTGWVVPASAPDALARAILDYSEAVGNSRPRNLAARRRIIENFGLDPMISATELLLERVVAARKGTPVQIAPLIEEPHGRGASGFAASESVARVRPSATLSD